MEPLRWILLLVGLVLIGAIFCYSRGWYPKFSSIRKRKPADADSSDDGAGGSGHDSAAAGSVDPQPAVRQPSAPPLEPESKVVAVRIMPQHGGAFPAEELVLALRTAGFRHGLFGIFHVHTDDPEERIRFSVASLVEPGSFDLSKLKESSYRGVSMFTIFPAAEEGVNLFDDMVKKARELAKDLDGVLTDEQGGAFSLQRERYMREDLIEYLRRQEFGAEEDRHTAA